MIYSFKCDTHGVFDKDLPVHGEHREHPCPVCDKKSKRKFHATGVLFRGNGFYVTDTPRAQHSTV